MPSVSLPRDVRLRGPRCSAVGVLAFAILTAGCSNVELSPTGSVDSGQAVRVAPVKTAARDANVSYLYVADDVNPYFAQVDQFQRKDLAKGIIGKVSKRIKYPAGIYVDSSDTLYVANELDSGGHDTVTAYKPGAEKPFRTYRGFCAAADVLAGSDGTVYIADLCGETGQPARARDDSCVANGAVHVYAPGSTKQIRILHFKGSPFSFALDDKNDLYVGYENACADKGQVRRYAPGAVKGTDLLPPKTIFSIGGIALDSRGELLAVDKLRGAIDVFTTEREPPSRIIDTGQTYPDRLAFDEEENRLYLTFPFTPDLPGGADVQPTGGSGPKRPNTLVVLDYQSGTLLYTLRKPIYGWVPSGVAAFPPEPPGRRF